MPRHKKHIIFTIPRLDDDSETHTFERLDDGNWSVDDAEITDSAVLALANAYADLADAGDEAGEEDEE